MANLVPVPWQPTLLLTPDTLAYLQAACRAAGRTLYINGEDGAWRSWARQNYLYQGYIQGLPGFNTASSPNPPGQRNHMRGGAFDLIDTDAATQAACRSVGLIRDGAEPWHWNNPNWANMPIILDNTSAAGGGAIPISGGFLMALTDAEQAELLNGVRNLYSGFFIKGPSMPDGGRALAQTVADLRVLLNQVVTQTTPAKVTRGADAAVTPVGATPVVLSKNQDDAETNTMARQILDKLATIDGSVSGPAIDYDALAAAIVKAGGAAPSAEVVGQAVALELSKLKLTLSA